MSVNTKIDITPDTKVGRMLEHFPELEEKLISLSPSFKKLRNPVLRRTIGKVATLRQVAKVGDISLAMLINELRKAAGMSEQKISEDKPGDSQNIPAWVDDRFIVDEFDARPVINAGEHPMKEVFRRIGQLKDNHILKLITAFEPTPLIDMAKGRGCLVWSQKEKDEIVNTYFRQK